MQAKIGAAADHARKLLAARGYPGAVITGVESAGDANLHGMELIFFVTRGKVLKTAFLWLDKPSKQTVVQIRNGWVGRRMVK